MRVSRVEAAEHRERIVESAARLFRERGFDGIGVADLMLAAGLTHGGFYGHFESKEALMAEASARALRAAHEYWSKLAQRDPEHALAALAASYLSTRHRDHPGRGCLLAALGSDVARQAAPVRSAVTAGVRSMVDLLAGLLPGRSRAARRDRALATYASLVGALVLARAVDDPALSEAILRAVADTLPAGR
jgi:TetR/AcrR family transcriptional repressor of nem operon